MQKNESPQYTPENEPENELENSSKSLSLVSATNSRSNWIKDSGPIVSVCVAGGFVAAMLTMYFGLYEPQLTGLNLWIFQAMRLYLICIFLRTGFHLFFSFASSLFQAQVPFRDDSPLVTVIIPCFNEEKVVRAAALSVLELDYPNLEVLVVDDGSTDLTLLEAKQLKRGAKLRVIHQENAGKANALNRGLSEAQGEYFLCMDADSLLHRDVIRLGVRHFAKNHHLAAVAGNVRLGNSGSLLVDFQRLEYISGLNFMKEAQSFLKAVPIVPGPIGLFDKEKVMKIGGYRSDTFAEDADLSIRLLMAGHDIVYDHEMIAVTEAPEDIRSIVSQRYRWTRGILQTLRGNLGAAFVPLRRFRALFILCYMLQESLLIPTANFFFAIYTLQLALSDGNHDVLLMFLSQLTVLDVLLAAYCLTPERNKLSLILLSVFSRLSYGLFLEILRFFALLDELIGFPMKWGKLQRKGLSQ